MANAPGGDHGQIIIEAFCQYEAISVLRPKLLKNLVEMEFDRSLCETEFAGDLLIGQPRGHQSYNLPFARTQSSSALTLGRYVTYIRHSATHPSRRSFRQIITFPVAQL